MEETLTSLNLYLEKTLNILNSELVKAELHGALHNHDEGVLPSASAISLANKTTDLFHAIDHLLEPGHLVLADHFLGYVHAKCLVAAVDLEIADALRANSPMTSQDLANTCGARADRLHQVLRALCSNNIMTSSSKLCKILSLILAKFWRISFTSDL